MVIPIFNEERTVAEVIQNVLRQPLVAEVIAVDDGSADSSWQILQQISASDARVKIVRHERNSGKGAALRTGLPRASAPFVIIQDADREYDPSEYPTMLAPILAGKADAVFGSRFLGGGSHRVLYFWHYLGNLAITLLSNMVTNLNLTDIECCYKAFRREIAESLRLTENRFGIEPEIVAKIARLKPRIYEVSISYHGRTYEEGKKIGWRDGFSAIRCIIKYGMLRM